MGWAIGESGSYDLSPACAATLEVELISIGTGANVDITDNCDPRTMFNGDGDDFQSATGCFCEDGSCQILMDCTLSDLLCALDSSDSTVCYTVTTSNWNCPNGMEIDGFYSMVGTINDKQAWQKSDGFHLRWASMWNQWIFDDDEVDNQSVAWRNSDASSTNPTTGTFADYRYGGTCGNNDGNQVTSITITEVDCNSEEDTPFVELKTSDDESGFCFHGSNPAFCMYSQVESFQECEQLCMDNEHCVVFQVSSDFTEPGRCDLFQMGSGSEIFTGCNGQIMANNQWADTLSITEAALAHTDWQCYGYESEAVYTRGDLGNTCRPMGTKSGGYCAVGGNDRFTSAEECLSRCEEWDECVCGVAWTNVENLYFCHLFTGSNSLPETETCQNNLSPNAFAGLYQPYGTLECGSEYHFAEDPANPLTESTLKSDWSYEEDCPEEMTLSMFGAGRCMSDGEIVPFVQETQTTTTTKEDCLAACEEDDECVAAMPAYDYYCQIFKMSDVSFVDGFSENYQPQWECYAKPRTGVSFTELKTSSGESGRCFDGIAPAHCVYHEAASLPECEQLCMASDSCVVFNAHINLFATGIPGRCDLFQTGTGSEIFTGCTASTGVIMANNQYTNTVPITEAAIAQANTRCYAKTSGSRFTCDSIQLAGVGLDHQECFNEEYPCDSCCSTGLTPNGNNCWDENYTQISCCGSESLSLEVGVIGVTQDNKDQVCDSIAGALGGSATHCSLAGPQSGRRRLTGGTTLFMDVTLSDPSSAPSQTIDSNFVGSLSGLPRGVAVTSVSTTNAESESVWYPNYYASWVDGHCLNSASTGVDSTFLASVSNYGTREECCSAAYGGQTSGACLREVWYPDYSASWVDGHCLNSASTGVDSRFLVSYATRKECCSAAYAGQTSGACLREDLDSTDPFCANAIYDSNYALLSWSDCVGNEYSDAYDAMAAGGWPCGCASGCVINGDGTSGGCQGHDPSSTTPYNSCVCPDNESSGRSRGPAEPCTMILCQNGCDLINTDANGCGGECSCPADPIM